MKKDRPMERLWAPWRMPYITRIGRKSSRCFLCIGHSRTNDAKRYIVRRSRYAFAILNVFPYNNGHLMIAPYRHVGTVEKLTPKELGDMMELVVAMKKLIDKRLRPHAYNIGMNLGEAAGAGVKDHIHLHIVPRWTGDSNFMPIIGGTKVISESLGELYRTLTKT